MSSDLTSAVTIPNTIVKHVLGDSDILLAEADLNLFVLPTPSEPSSHAQAEAKDEEPIMTLTVGKAAFPLFRTTLFGTLADDETAYIFSPPITEAEGYVKIVLPQGVKEPGSGLSKLRDAFEGILIQYGLLKEGIEAVGDEVGRSFREHTQTITQRIQEATTGYLRENPPTNAPAEVSHTAQTVAATSASATDSLFRAASLVTSMVGSAASSTGSWVTAHVVPTNEENTRRLDSLSNAYDSIADGVTNGTAEVKNATTDGAGSVLENDLGPEARSLIGNAAQSVGNVAGAVGQTSQVTTAIAVGGLKGAAVTENQQQAEKDRKEQRETLVQWEEVVI